MSRMSRIASFILAFILVGAGLMKFTNGHVFQYLEAETGLGIMHPYVNHVVGAFEILAGLLLRFRRARLVGAAAALTIAGGAVLTHLSPWLGISPPTGFADGAEAPWDRADFTTATSPSLFIMALVTLALAAAAMHGVARRPGMRPASPGPGPRHESAPLAHSAG